MDTTKTKKRRPARRKNKAPSQKKATPPRKKATAALVSSQRKKEILGVILMALALLLSLALVTYNPGDNHIARDFSPGAMFDPGGNQAENALGLIGAVLAFWVVPNFLGYVSVLLTGLLFVWGYVVFRDRKTVYLPLWSLLTVAVALVLATLLGWIGLATGQDWSVWSGALGQGFAGWRLEHVEGQPLCGLAADPGQPGEGRHQLFECLGAHLDLHQLAVEGIEDRAHLRVDGLLRGPSSRLLR